MTREMKKTLRGRLPDGTANPIDIYVGNRIQLRRKLLGLSQEKLAAMLGITFQQVQKYEKGMNRIGASRLWDMSNILDVPVSFFFSGLTKEETDKSPAALNGLKIEKEQADTSDPLTDNGTIEMITAFNKIKNPELKEGLRKAIIAAGKNSYLGKDEPSDDKQ